MADDKPDSPGNEGIAAGPPIAIPPSPGASPPGAYQPGQPMPAPAADDKKPARKPREGVDPPKGHKPGEMKDGWRELVETIVFVVVLVLMLKTFLAEAFVIPTGSMATTLLGYHKQAVCQQCNYPFLVNVSSEADPQDNRPVPVISCKCPNCGFRNQLRPMGGRP
jgi:hypothetical protein